MANDAIPAGYQAVTPYLMVDGVADLLAYLGRAFGGEAVFRMDRADGTVAHAEVRIDGAAIMLGEPTAEFGPMPTHLYLYTVDCDAAYRRAVEAGGEPIQPPTTMPFAGQRYGAVRDPAGNIWWIATHLESLPANESKARFAEWQRERAEQEATLGTAST
jgi:PhnB protein